MINLSTKCFDVSYTSAFKSSIESYLFDTFHEIEEHGNVVKLTIDDTKGLIEYIEKEYGSEAEITTQLYTLWKNMYKNERLIINWS